jgi:GTP cyclohydrolase I
VGYIPNGKLLGISKIARLVDCFARRLQLQERLTAQVADSMMEHLEPRGVGVIIKAEHTCMTMRGVNKPGTKTITAAMRGLFLDDDKTRAEFLELIELGGGE